MKLYDMIRYDMIYLLTAIGLTEVGRAKDLSAPQYIYTGVLISP